jgi:uncharacterized SAM-binding protein YcdF (DUF218 family)
MKDTKQGSGAREISKLPQAPPISDDLIKALTELCFSEDPLEKAGVLLVFGSNILQEELSRLIDRLLEQDLAKTVIITGGLADYDHTQTGKRAESEAILSHIRIQRFPAVRFLTETHSRNSLENVLEARKLYPLEKERSILFLSHAHASGRSRLTLKKISPHSKLISHPYEVPMGDGQNILRKSDWWRNPLGTAMIWGEFLRIVKYGERGDISIEEIRDRIKHIKQLAGL